MHVVIPYLRACLVVAILVFSGVSFGEDENDPPPHDCNEDNNCDKEPEIVITAMCVNRNSAGICIEWVQRMCDASGCTFSAHIDTSPINTSTTDSNATRAANSNSDQCDINCVKRNYANEKARRCTVYYEGIRMALFEAEGVCEGRCIGAVDVRSCKRICLAVERPLHKLRYNALNIELARLCG